MVLCQGNHFALRAGHVVPGIVLPHTSLGHYPKRSAEQLNTKIVLGWLAYLAWRGDAADSGLGQHWLHEFQKIIDVGLVSTVEGELIDGISQPQHFTYTRKYPIEPRPMFSRVIADCARAFTLKGPDADVACLANNLEVAWRSTQPTDYLCYTQFLILEAGPRCNMRHAACPANVRGAGERLLDVDEMVRLAIEAYQLHGFRGLVGFHYYNEPMLEFAKIYAVATRVREQVGTAQFVLWTNGTIQPDDDRMKIFQQVYCTDYVGDEARLAAYYRQYSPLVTINRPNFDSRLSPKGAIFDHHPCGRPLIECIIDAWGRMRFCCQDWRGQIVLGDVRTSSLRELLGARHRLIKEVCGGTMTDTAPTRCIRCDGRTGIATFQRQIADEAREWCKGLP
jgi:hypothetical protein